jgi:TM2 domain-containing membrane protein YozV
MMSDYPQAVPATKRTPVSTDATIMMRYDANKSSAGVAYLLLIFFGIFGAHRFYLGRSGSAAAMLIIFIASFVLSFVFVGFVGFIVLATWVFVDLFLIPGIVAEHNNRLIADLGR